LGFILIFFSKITDEIELHEATMAGIVGGLIVSGLYGLIILTISRAYFSATNIYDRELDVVLYPYLHHLILAITALVLTLIFWRWKSRVAIILLLVIYLYRLVSYFIATGGMIDPYNILSLFIILLLVTGIRAAFYISKTKSMTNPDVFN